jgi:hypothetical protein
MRVMSTGRRRRAYAHAIPRTRWPRRFAAASRAPRELVRFDVAVVRAFDGASPLLFRTVEDDLLTPPA